MTFSLFQNYPNPFNLTTVIGYSIPRRSLVILTVYNVLGKKVATLYSGYQNPGNYQITFNGNRYASGVYFYCLEAGSLSFTKKMMLIK
ncbi:MAG: T9SS type A sorting domain-containing protein [Candidatus Kryptoniota bacterium]